MSNETQDVALSTFLKEREKLVALACALVGSRAVAEDLIQDSWLRWSGNSYPSDKARPIFRRIVANLAKDWHRRQKTERIAMATHVLTFDNAPDTERVVIARQDLEKTISALSELPDRSVKALRLHRVDGLTYAQIAEKIDTVPSRAYTLVEEAIVHIAVRLSE